MTYSFSIGPIFVELSEDWSQFFRLTDWRHISVIRFDVEDDISLGDLELSIAFAGIGLRVRVSYADTEKERELFESLERVEKKLAGFAEGAEKRMKERGGEMTVRIFQRGVSFDVCGVSVPVRELIHEALDWERAAEWLAHHCGNDPGTIERGGYEFEDCSDE